MIEVQNENLEHLNEMAKNLPYRNMFYKKLLRDLKNEDYYEIITYDINFLIDCYFNFGFHKVTKEEILAASKTLDFLEGILVAELLDVNLEDNTREKYTEVSDYFSYYRMNDKDFKNGKIELSDDIIWSGKVYKKAKKFVEYKE